MKIALVAIAKNEDKYLDEWVKYHNKLGFDRIFLYENDWVSNYNHPNVYSIGIPGRGKQLTAYNHFIEYYRFYYDYVAFIDIDEFIVLKKHNTIHEFMEDYKEFNGVALNWVFFGDNGLEMSDDFSVLRRFTKRQKKVNKHIKSIIKPMPKPFMAVHHPLNFVIVDPHKNKLVDTPFNFNGTDDIAYIAHYCTKTKGEYKLRIQNGRSDGMPNRTMRDFHRNNFNEIEDTSALDFFNK